MSFDSRRFRPPGMKPIEDPLAKKPRSRLDELPDRHLLRVFMHEHDDTQAVLAELQITISHLDIHSPTLLDELGQMETLCQILNGRCQLRQREEEILLPELEAKGGQQPAHMMRNDRAKIQQLDEILLKELKNLRDPKADVKKITWAGRELIRKNHAYIYKVTNILYPLAISLIHDQSLWNDMLLRSLVISLDCPREKKKKFDS